MNLILAYGQHSSKPIIHGIKDWHEIKDWNICVWWSSCHFHSLFISLFWIRIMDLIYDHRKTVNKKTNWDIELKASVKICVLVNSENNKWFQSNKQANIHKSLCKYPFNIIILTFLYILLFGNLRKISNTCI